MEILESGAAAIGGAWVHLVSNYIEDWAMMHCRYASAKVKLDGYLFEEKDGGLVKTGGTGRVELHEVECHIGEDFMAARDFNRFPAKAYRMIKRGYRPKTFLNYLGRIGS